MIKHAIKNSKQFMRTQFKRLSLLEKLWLFAPLVIWFSYHPMLRLGKNASMNFELSVTLVYLIVLALVSVPVVWRAKKDVLRSGGVKAVTAFVLISGVSLLWTENIARGVLTFGIIGALYVIFLAALMRSEQIKRLVPVLWSVLLASAVVMSILAFVQLVAAVWLGGDDTLLCRGCVPNQFGFARPNVFAIEPQFFGNMLLAPALILLHKLQQKKQETYQMVAFVLIMTALFLTLSRGAIYAFGIGAVILAVVHHKRIAALVKPAGYVLMSFIISLFMQGAAAAASPDLSATFKGAVSATVNQLSLGVIDIDVSDESSQPTDNGDASSQKAKPSTQETKEERQDEVDPNFEGYVAESTNVRLKLTRLAVQSWAGEPWRVAFGVGLGGSGDVLHREFPEQVNQREIVQNEYAEILLETGLVGLGLFLSIIGMLLYGLRHQKWAWAVVIALLVQWNFFSGYPNALHIYLLFILLAVALKGAQLTPKHKH